MPVFAHCTVCNLDFPSRGIVIEGATNALLSGNVETCPRCGSYAQIMEGQFNLGPDSVEMLAGPEWTRDLLIRLSKQDIHRLRTAVAWARQSADSGDDEHRARVLEKSVLSAVPQLEQPLQGLRQKVQHEYDNHLAAWVGVLMTLIMLIVTMNGSEGISGEQLEQILDETVRHAHSEQGHTVDGVPAEVGKLPPSPGEVPPATEIPTPETH